MTSTRPIFERVATMFTASTAAALLVRGPDAHADDLIVGRPGAHPDYIVELEPEAIVLFGRAIGDGPGVGVRASIPVMKNGFISSLNNVPAVSFGFSRSPLSDNRAPFYAPAVLQWSFWLSQRWSVLGEAGVFLVFGDGTRTELQPAFMGGGRLHLTDRIALTARISLPNTPSIGIGVSFFL